MMVRTIKSTREIDRLFHSARRVESDVLLGLVGESSAASGAEGRVAYIAGRRVGGAVERNRAKRLLREAARAVGDPPGGVDVALVARRAILSADRTRIERAVELVMRSGARSQ